MAAGKGYGKRVKSTGNHSPGRSRMPNSMACGIDIGDSTSLASVYSPSGELVDRFEFEMNSKGYEFASMRVPKEARIACEATGMTYPLVRALEGYGYDVTVANPKQLKWIVKSKKKSDKVDSEKLARLLMVGMLPEAHLMSREEQRTRDLLVQRVLLGREIGRMKARILSYLKREGLNEGLPKTEDNFSVARRNAIRSLEFDDVRYLVMKTMMDGLEFLEGQCPPLELEIKKFARESEGVKILMSIGGVDYYSASLYSSIIGDVNRYPDDDHLASYLGVIPAEGESSGVKRVGKMSKDGPSLGRWVLDIMAGNAVRYNPPIRQYYQSALRRTGRAKKAKVLTMRKLVRMTYFMLKKRENWKYEKRELTEGKLSRLRSTGRDGDDEGGDT
ncbi:MAG: IS110 family transposase [Nitrososphaerota archaeon]|nr:IS110 family transposase [Nitrososphaerota archaeon]